MNTRRAGIANTQPRLRLLPQLPPPRARTARTALRRGRQAPLADASVDAVTIRYLLWTLTDPVAALRSWSRLVVPGGIIACVDAPWFPQGISEETEVVSEDGPDAFTRAYHPGTLEHLPLAEAQGAEDFAAVFTAAGLIDVTVTPIPEVNELDRRFGLSPGHESSPQYVVTGRVAEKEQ